MRRAAGFTLLEVMIALSILAVALVAISNLNGGAVAMHAYSRRATEATLLLRGKMLDVEDDLQKNGFSDFNDEKHGDFSSEGAAGYAWSAEILKPDVQLDPAQLLTLLGAQGKTGQPSSSVSGAAQTLAASLSGAPGATQGLQGGGGAAMLAGPMGGMFMNQAKTFIETLKKSVREIRLTVSWQDGKDRRDVAASQIVVILPESVGKTPGAPPPPGTTAAGAPAQPGNPTTPIPGRGGQQ